jgi:hypothetical protein
MRRTLISVVFATLIGLVVATPAYAGAHLDEAVAALKNTSAFVAVGTEGTDSNTANNLAAQLSGGDTMVVAMLPANAASEFGGEAQNFAQQLDDALGNKHIVAVSIGNDVATATQLLPDGVASDLMVRAGSVSTSTPETLGTFIRNVHTWQAAHPEEVAKRQPSKERDENSSLPWLLAVGISLSCALSIYLIYRTVRPRRQSREPKVKLQSPSRLQDELRDILARRSKIQDPALRETITQMVRDTEVVFRRLRANATPVTVETTSASFEGYLQSVLSVLDQYIDVQENTRYYDNPQGALADGRDAINGFAEYVLNSAKRAGRQDLTQFRVNTKILSAQKYA